MTIQNIKTKWKDSYQEVHPNLEPGFTYHAFEGDKAKTNKGKIDYIFIKGSIFPKKASVIKGEVKEPYPSDHYFVSAILQL